MQKIIFGMLCLLLLLKVGVSAAQEPTIPPIVYQVDDQLWYYDGSATTLISENIQYSSNVAWSPDGTWLAYITTQEDPAADPIIHLTDIKGTTLDLIVPLMGISFPFSWTADGRILYAVFSSQDQVSGISIWTAYAIVPQTDAQPELVGNFEVGVISGGGSIFPAIGRTLTRQPWMVGSKCS